MTELFSYLEQYGKLSEEDQKLIKANSKLIKLKKGNYFLEAGKPCNQIGFVLSGILRTFYYNYEGKDITKYFNAKEQFATNLESFNKGVLSDTYIQAEIDSVLIVITKQEMNILSTQIEKWETMIKDIIESKLLAKVSLKTNMLNQDASTRYLYFLETHPQLINHVPINHIASYLGITQYSLSRIRKNVLKHHFLPIGKN